MCRGRGDVVSERMSLAESCLIAHFRVCIPALRIWLMSRKDAIVEVLSLRAARRILANRSPVL